MARSIGTILQLLAALAVLGFGVYLILTDRWALGGVCSGVGVSLLPLPFAGVVGALMCLGFAGAGYYLGRLTALIAGLVAVLAVITLADRLTHLGSSKPGNSPKQP